MTRKEIDKLIRKLKAYQSSKIAKGEFSHYTLALINNLYVQEEDQQQYSAIEARKFLNSRKK